MTIVILKGQEIEFQVNEGETLFDLLLAAQEKLWQDGRELDSVVVDGQMVDPLTDEKLKSIPAENLRVEISLTEARPEPTLETILPEAIGYLNILLGKLSGIAEAMRSGQLDQKAFTMFKDSLEGLSFILDLVQTIHDDSSCSSEIKDQIGKFSPELMEILKEINEAQESNDISMLSDLVEYEMPELAEQIRDIMEKFLETL